MAANATVAKLNIHLGASSTAVAAGLAPAQASLAALGNQINTLRYSMAGLAGGAVLGWGVKLAAEMETAAVAFEVMIGDAGRAKQLFGELKDFAVATPFEFGELRDASRTLLAMGIGVNDVMRTIKMLGDVSSGTNQPLNEMAGLFGQVAVAGRLTGNELRQFNERGIPLMEALGQQMGVTKAEIREMVEAGKISFADVEKAMASMTQSGGRFSGLMERQSQTLAGRFSTLSDTAKLAAANFGTALAPALSKLIEAAIPLADALANMNLETTQNVIKIAAWVGGMTAAVVIIPKVISGIVAMVAAARAWATAQSIALAFSGPKGWAILAGSVLAAGAAAWGISAAFADVEKTAQGAADATSATAKATQDAKNAAAAAVPAIDAVADAQRRRAEAEKAAQKTFSEFNAMQEEANRIREDVATPEERFAEEQARLRKLLQAGAIDPRTFGRAMEKATEALRQHKDEANAAADARRRLNSIDAPQGLIRGTSAAASANANFRFNNPVGDALLQQIVDLLREAPMIGRAKL
jgi:tape measure domain-containing protein